MCVEIRDEAGLSVGDQLREKATAATLERNGCLLCRLPEPHSEAVSFGI